MSDETERSKPLRPLVLAEDLSGEVAELLRYAQERGLEARKARVADRRYGAVRTLGGDIKPDISDLLREELADVLEDEVVSAVDPGPGRGILEWELRREVAKKALVGLKVNRLRELAAGLHLDKRGRTEEVAERIARAYRYDEEEIARLVLDNEEEPEPERGHLDRVFPVVTELDVEVIAERLATIVGRYIRVGVARWFVFDEVVRAATSLKLRGTLRAYRAFVTMSDEDETGEVAHLSSSPTETEIEIEIVNGSRTLRIRGAGLSPSRASARALEAATQTRLLGHVPLPSQSFEGPLGTFARSTVLMLDLLDNRLLAVGAREPNLTVARFEIDSEGGSRQQGDGERPTLREVRFEGDHLLDSVPACRLISVERRALIELSLRVSAGDPNADARFPVRVSLERDHATVLTGFGRQEPKLSAALHRALVRAVEDAFEEGVGDVGRLEALAVRIDEFARSNREATRATMLSGASDGADDAPE